jgi:DNA invertase Pin-like site-specific DNA recombinase
VARRTLLLRKPDNQTVVCITLGVVRVTGYVRVSTSEQGDSGLGLDAQRAAIASFVGQRGWDLVGVHEDVTSGKNMRRPGLTAALAAVESHQAEALVVAKLDRLSRSLIDFVSLMERSRTKGWAVVALDLGVDTTTPTGEMVANIMATFAQFERRIIGQRTRDALAVKKQRGDRLGRPRSLPDAVVGRLEALRAEGRSLRAIAEIMDREGVPTAQGGYRWHGNTVRQILSSRAS